MNRFGEKFANLAMACLAGAVAISVLREVSGTGVLIALIAAPILAPLLLGPFLIHRTHWSALEPNFAPFDPDGPDSPPELRRYFAQAAEELELLGFEHELSRRTKQATNNAEGFVSLFRNRETMETARIITAVGATGIVRIAYSDAGFRTEFSDGTEVVTSNRRSPKVYPTMPPPYHGQAFPQIREIGHLLVIHRALADHFGAGRIPVDAVGDDPGEFLRQVDHKRPQAHHVACGYNYVDEMAGVQRLTWKGAVLMTWKLSPPIKQVRLAWERFRAARLLGKLKAGRAIG